MGLNVDIDRIHEENLLKSGARKMGMLVNHGDRQTKEEKLQLQ